MSRKLNVLIIGNGHYSTGSTPVEGKRETDKDFGVLLPSVLELRKQGLVDQIYLAATDGVKLQRLRQKLAVMKKSFGWDTDITLFPGDATQDRNAYKDALDRLPKPAAVLIATPDHLHKEMILESIKHRAHFMVVKPAVTTMADWREIVEAQERAGVLGLVDYHKAYDEANLIIKDDYEQGKYGKIQHFFSKMTQRKDMLKIFGKWAGGQNNVNHYLGSHYIHLVGFITKARPLNVRATGQYGIAREEYGLDTPDLIETQVEWESGDGHRFTSYHISGWADPQETAGMTYQEIHIIGTAGHVESDQRFRGFETTLSGKGHAIVNPYFFHLNRGIDGSLDLDGKYGFRSIKTFVRSALVVEDGTKPESFEGTLPTLRESMHVTAILEAADRSLAEGSMVVDLDLAGKRS